MTEILIYAAVALVAVVTVGLIITRLYKRAGKETAFVRTGLGGEKVVLNGGAIVLPVVHETIKVNMTTLSIVVERKAADSLITNDRMRVDVHAEFFVRVAPNAESISKAAQTLGKRTMIPAELKGLIEGKFVDALRNVAASMNMDELHEKRTDFVQKVQQACQHDLATNGLELETVSLTGLNQTSIQHFNPDNAFDAEGLTQLTRRIEERKKIRNDIEADNRVQIEAKNLEANRRSLEISQEAEFARLEQERAVRTQTAEQEAQIAQQEAQRQSEIAANRAAREQESQAAQIKAKLETEQAQIAAKQATEQAQIAADRNTQQVAIERDRDIALARQNQQIAISETSRKESEAKAEADRARAVAVTAEQGVITAREQAEAERNKVIQLVDASREAERLAIGVRVTAEAEKQAANDRAEAIRLAAQGESDAEKLRAEAAAVRYQVDAEGKRALNEASNLVSSENMAFQNRQTLLRELPAIIRETVKPMESIDSIRIMDVTGLGGVPAQVHGGGAEQPAGTGSLADSAVNAALRYRAHAPVLDSLLKEIGMDGTSVRGLVGADPA